jgi:dolichol-phosphate mannosyltransferase
MILCTRNEAIYIKNTISELEKNIQNLELIIVDDNSTDGTKEIINQLNYDNRIKIIFRKKSKGLASAFSRGILETTGDYIGWLDTNMGELVSRFKEMSDILGFNNDIVILSRYIEGGGDKRNLLRVLSSKYINILCRLMLSSTIKDYTTSIFLMKRKVLDEVTFLGYGHGEFFIEFLHNAYKKSFIIKEIPYIQNKEDGLQVSKTATNLIKFFYLGLMYIIRIFTTIIRRN